MKSSLAAQGLCYKGLCLRSSRKGHGIKRPSSQPRARSHSTERRDSHFLHVLRSFSFSSRQFKCCECCTLLFILSSFFFFSSQNFAQLVVYSAGVILRALIVRHVDEKQLSGF